MQKFVTKYLTAEELQKVNGEVTASAAIVKPSATSLNNEEKVGIRTIAEGREGYARSVSRVSLSHVLCLPRNEDPAELEAGMAYYDELMKARTGIAYLLEMVDDTAVALGADMMAIADRYVGYLQQARKGDTSLDAAMEDIDAYNKRFGSRPAEEEPGEEPEAPVKE